MRTPRGDWGQGPGVGVPAMWQRIFCDGGPAVPHRSDSSGVRRQTWQIHWSSTICATSEVYSQTRPAGSAK